MAVGIFRSKLLLYVVCVLNFHQVLSQANDKLSAVQFLGDIQNNPEKLQLSSFKYSQIANEGIRSLSSRKNVVTYDLVDDSENDIGYENVSLDEDGDVYVQSQALAAKNYNVSDLCLNHTLMYLAALTERQQWALSMLDAAGKLPSGILQGNLAWRGGYGECVNVTAVVYSNFSSKLNPTYPFKGRYCQIIAPLGGNPNSTTPPQPNGINGLFGATPSLTIGVCLPDSCSGDDLVGLVNSGLSVIPVQLPNIRLYGKCQKEKDIASDGRAIAVIIVASLLGALVLLGTGLDIIRYQLPAFVASLPNNNDGLINDVPYMSNGSPEHMGHTVTEKTSLLGDDGEKKADISSPGIAVLILLAFSIYSNGKKLLATKQGEGTLTAVHGVRFFSMTWVILGHTYVFGLGAGDNLGSFLPAMIQRFTFQGIFNATVSVDSFFLLSGLLVGFLTLKEMDKGKGRLNWAMFYFHRFWRLTPPYMLVLMVYVPLFKYWGDGPMWPEDGMELNYCRNSWWTNLLYINNLVRVKEMCMGWSWYLANDMQFFIISPLILIPLYYSRWIGVIIISVLLILSSLATALLSNHFNVGLGLTGGSLDYFLYIYIRPYCRIGPYLIGLLVGYALYRTKCKPKINPILVIVGWVCAIVIALSVLYGLYDTQTHGQKVLSSDVSALYNALNRTGWGVALGWLIFACATGYGGFVNTLLSWTALIPLSRLTYCAYLVHPIVMYLYYSSLETALHFTDLTVIYLFLGHLVLAYMTAFVVSLVFESPMMGLERVVFRREKRS